MSRAVDQFKAKRAKLSGEMPHVQWDEGMF